MGVEYQQPDIVSVWDKVTNSYNQAATEGPDYQANLRVMLDCIGNPTGKWICEVGCGSGATSAELQRLGARTLLVDISSKAIGFARKHYRNMGLQAEFCLQNGLQLGFRGDIFDVVWNGGVIEHFIDDGKVALIREMYRVVKPGGLLFIAVPNAMDLPFMLGKKVEELRGTWKFGYEDDLTLGRFRTLATRAGIGSFELFAYNPVVGWWFLPYGFRICEMLRLNTLEWHARRSRFGHVLCLIAKKLVRSEGE